MGNKIQPSKFRGLNNSSTKVYSSHSLIFRRQFGAELEIKGFLLDTLQNTRVHVQDCSFEQSVSHGLVIRLKFLSQKVPFQLSSKQPYSSSSLSGVSSALGSHVIQSSFQSPLRRKFFQKPEK